MKTQRPTPNPNKAHGAQYASLKTDLLYALGAVGSMLIWSVVNGWLLYFYIPPEGDASSSISTTSYIAAVVISQGAGIVAAPIVGHLADRALNRWQRRLSLILVAGLPLLVSFVLLWTPPARDTTIWNMVYLAIVLALHMMASSLFEVSYTALLPALALTDQHRVRVSAWRAGFQTVGAILSGLVGIIIERLGYLQMALVCAVAALPFMSLPFLILRRQRRQESVVTPPMGFWSNLADTLRNSAFRTYLAAWMLSQIAVVSITPAIPYIATEICALTETGTTYFYITGIVVSLACYPVVTQLAARWGKWHVYAGSLLASAFTLAMLPLIGEWIPLPLDVQGLVWFALIGAATSALLVLSAAFPAEISDRDAILTGQRREGIYYATLVALNRVINGVALAIVSLLLLLGHSRANPLGVHMVGLVGGAMALIAFLIFVRYPLRATDKHSRRA
jgi:GPH family glycoside/pentoside/hexuronide:cation symporter